MYAEFVRDLLQINLRYGLELTGLPQRQTTRTSSPRCSSTRRAAATTPKARFAYLFPSERSALIQVRLKPDLSDAQRAEARRARARGRRGCREWRLQGGARYTVTGAPVVAEDLADALAGLDAAPAARRRRCVMALVLALVFRSRLRLLPLAVALRRWRSRSARWRCSARR